MILHCRGSVSTIVADDTPPSWLGIHRCGSVSTVVADYTPPSWLGIQHRGSVPTVVAQYTLSTSSYEDADHKRILKDLNILNVRHLVELDTASLMYRVENDLVPAHVKNMFTKCSEIHAYNTRVANVGNYATTKMRTEKRKQAFQQTGPKVWNKLPDFVRRSQSIESFLPPPQARDTFKYFLAQQHQQNQTITTISSTLHLPDFFQKDAHLITKLHIQVYPCHHVLECR